MPKSSPPVEFTDSKHPEREYLIEVKRFAWGSLGERIKLRLSEGQHKSFLDAGTLSVAPVAPAPKPAPDVPAPGAQATPEAPPVAADEKKG